MIKLKNQEGVTLVIAVLVVLVVAVVGAVALRTGSAYYRRTPKSNTTTRPIFNNPSTNPTKPNTINPTGGSSTCRANGATVVAPPGSSCNISSVDGRTICKIDDREVDCQ